VQEARQQHAVKTKADVQQQQRHRDKALAIWRS